MMVFKAVGRAANQQQSNRFVAGIFQRVCLFERDKDGIARRDLAHLIADSHASSALQYVVNLFGFKMMMTTDGRPHGQNLFGQAAHLNVRCGAVNERANLGPMRCVDYSGALKIDDDHGI